MEICNLHPMSYFKQIDPEDMFSSMGNIPEDILIEAKLEKGDRFETDFEIKGEVFNLEKNPVGILEITHDIFIQASQEGFFFSLDGMDWKTFDEIFTGNFGVGLSYSENGPQLSGNLLANIRETIQAEGTQKASLELKAKMES